MQSEFSVPNFIINSPSAELHLSYLISLDLERKTKNFLHREEGSNFVEVKSLQVYIHYGSQSSIEYIATKGTGYKLPKIYYNAASK